MDGLDEDRGVTGPGAHSIAGLLPASPPDGARVVVAGRPNPPIPADVPCGHPLRNPAIIETLRKSDRAATIKADMQADLYRLRTGSPLGRDLLGLVTAAGGGLSGRDLEELSSDPDVTEWDIEQLLSTVTGRSFASRVARWDPADGPRVYLLGHEELQQDAVRAYGSKELAAYRQRLHALGPGLPAPALADGYPGRAGRRGGHPGRDGTPYVRELHARRRSRYGRLARTAVHCGSERQYGGATNDR